MSGPSTDAPASKMDGASDVSRTIAPSPSITPSASTTSGDVNGRAADSLILTARPPHSRVLIIRLNRPKVLNALSTALVDLLLSALRSADADPDIGAVVLTGNERVFAGEPPQVARKRIFKTTLI